MRYLLDTNIISSLLKGTDTSLIQHIANIGDNNVCTSIIVAAELRYGAQKKGSTKLIERVETILETIEVLSLESPTDTIYGQIRTNLEKEGKIIGANDLLIAAQTMALNYTLVTRNIEGFNRITSLKVQTW